VDFLKGCNMSFRRDALVPVDPKLIGAVPYGFEIGLGLAVRARGLRIVYDPLVLVDHFPTTDVSVTATLPAYITNHNQTYLLLRFLPWPRKVAFLFYTFLLGDRNTIGFIRIPGLVLVERAPLRSISAHFVGKLHGFLTYVASYRATRVPY
jgi:hypothetical protein